MARIKDLNIIAVGGFLITIFYVIVRYPNMVGMDPASGGILFQLLPSLILIIVSLFVAKQSNGATRAGAVTFIGVTLAYLINVANGLGLITVDMLSGLTIAQLQIWVVVMGAIFGAIAYASS
jgi:hypothetical protein